jgi:hypothetical protein
MSYRIVCTDQKRPTHHNHIVGVGVGDNPDKASQQFTVAEVRSMILNGTRFYTQGRTSGKVANVERFDCPCGYKTIRSTPDAVADNNLDNLRVCNWG